jgi:ADP-ribose pyrophosphatase
VIRCVLLFIAFGTIYAEDSTATYLKFLKENKEVSGIKGNYKEGEIEIITDPVKILEVEKLQKARCLKSGMSEEAAALASKIGIIVDDLYWVFLRDAVIFPTGAEGSYNRIIWKSALDKGPAGVAILPLFSENKIGAIVAFRHATRSWELEIPRGARQTSEAIEIAVKRELEEETGLQTNETIFLGNMAPDPGMASTITPVYLAKIEGKGVSNQDYSEAILGLRVFTLSEIKKALKDGYLELEIKGKKEKVYVRDSYLVYALFLAECRGII